ncbi:MAG: TolC family protein [Verrucomicrobia bacterium]|nr:TolC family protein [Verrucomicrobiota bacterium]
MKIILSMLLIGPLTGVVDGQLASRAAVAEGGTNAVLALGQILSEVLSNNPSLQAARATWEAMQERVPQARAWDDLRLGVDVVADRTVAVPPNSFTDQRYSAEQAIPLSGKNRLRGRAANAEALAALADWQRRQLDLVAQARTAYYRLANGYAQLDLNRQNIELLKQFAAISRDKYEVGRQNQADVLTAETERARLEEGRFDLLRQISDEQSALDVLMNRPARAPLGRPVALEFAPSHWALDQLEHLALNHRPELRIARLEVQAALARRDLARREWYPDPALRLEASQYNETSHGISEVMAGIVFNVPWLNHGKYTADVRENKKLVQSAQLQLEAAEAQTLGMVRDQLQAVETFHHHYQLFRDQILPLARQTVEARRAAYEADQASFLDLILAQRTLRETESLALQHLADYLAARAKLQAMVGTDLPGQPSAALPTAKETK